MMQYNDQTFYAQNIRSQYVEKQHTKLETLMELDTKVKRPAIVFACLFGVLGALVMGSGMSLVMTDIGKVVGIADGLLPGIAIGIVGMVMLLLDYPISKGILAARKKKYADKIIALSDELMKG